MLGNPGHRGHSLNQSTTGGAGAARLVPRSKNIRIEERWAGSGSDTALLDASAAELVKLDPDVIVAQATPATTALLRLTHSLPVVFLAVSVPVGQGLVASISRPGGNATGFTSFEFSVGSKWFELIKELAPGIRRLAAVFNPKTAPYAPRFIQSFDAAVRDFGAEIKPARIESVEEIEAVVRG